MVEKKKTLWGTNEIAELCKGVHCVDLGESFPTHIYLQNFASIQPRTSPLKFARPSGACAPRLPGGWPRRPRPCSPWSPTYSCEASFLLLSFLKPEGKRRSQISSHDRPICSAFLGQGEISKSETPHRKKRYCFHPKWSQNELQS